MGLKAKWEYFRAIYERYRQADRKTKQAILSEFCLNTHYHRKYAIRLLNGPAPGKRSRDAGHARRRGWSYGHQTLSILEAVWEAAGYPWSVRLKALLPLWMPWIRKRFGVRPEIERQLLRISARQIDRRLRAKKTQHKRRMYGDRSGFAFRQLGGWRIWAHPERDGYSHQLDRIASGAGERANRSASGAGSGAERAAVPPAGSGFGQRVGIHQLAFESLVRASGDSTHSGAALQERRQRPRGTEKLDSRAQAAGLGPL